ncbi:MAG: hypothetical protein ACTHMB_11745, partial [Candidatus Binatia bacterium]
LPFVGAVAVVRGLFVSIVALLYVLFAVGAFLGKKLALVAGAQRSSDQSPSRIRRRRARRISDPGIGLVGGSCNFNFLYFSHRERTP